MNIFLYKNKFLLLYKKVHKLNYLKSKFCNINILNINLKIKCDYI